MARRSLSVMAVTWVSGFPNSKASDRANLLHHLVLGLVRSCWSLGDRLKVRLNGAEMRGGRCKPRFRAFGRTWANVGRFLGALRGRRTRRIGAFELQTATLTKFISARSGLSRECSEDHHTCLASLA